MWMVRLKVISSQNDKFVIKKINVPHLLKISYMFLIKYFEVIITYLP